MILEKGTPEWFEYLEELRWEEEWHEREYAKKQEQQKWQDFVVERRLEELKDGVQ